MSDGLTISEISMLNDLRRMQVLSQNLANVNTSGYKQGIPKTQGFQDTLKAYNQGQVDVIDKSQISAQVPGFKTVVDSHSGALKYTGMPLDIALADNVYLPVKSAAGEAYTRQGDLHIDAYGVLVTSKGLPVQGVSGEIRLTSDKPVINQQGEIYIDDQLIAQLKLTRFDKSTALESLGNGLYRTTSTGTVVSEGNVLKQGYTEASNVNMTDQMVKMIELTRHFETTQRLIRGYDEMMDSAIKDIADFKGY